VTGGLDLPRRQQEIRVSKRRTGKPPSENLTECPFCGQGEYSYEEFFIPAQDDKGHSAREMIRITPELERDISIIIEGKKFPYKTRSDLIRHAMTRHVRLLHRLEPDYPKHLITAHEAQMEAMREEEMRLHNHKVFAKLHEQVEAYLSSNEPGEARRLASVVRSKLQGVPDSAWKRRFETRFLRQYAALLNGEPVVMAGGE
jgi:hypothetical protein